MKILTVYLFCILTILSSCFLETNAQTTGTKGSTVSQTKNPVSSPKPVKTTAQIKQPVKINSQRDGIIYERRLNNEAARGKVESKGGSKAAKPYIGKTTENRFNARKSEHAKKLGVSKKDLDMKIVARKADRRAIRAVEQGIIRKRGGVNNLANKRNSIAPKKWESHTNKLRQDRLRELKRRGKLMREKRPL